MALYLGDIPISGLEEKLVGPESEFLDHGLGTVETYLEPTYPTGTNSQILSYIVPQDDDYYVSVSGAGGCRDYYASSQNKIPGKGARIDFQVHLFKNDQLLVIPGKMGSISGTPSSTYTGNDFTSGGGGGATIIALKVTPNTSVPINQLIAYNGDSYKLLVFAAGGCGTCDTKYKGTNAWDGPNGGAALGTNLYTPSSNLTSNLVNLSSITSSATSYSRNGVTAYGGYPYGKATDDSSGAGGSYTTNVGTASGSSTTSFIDNTICRIMKTVSGSNSGCGFINIYKRPSKLTKSLAYIMHPPGSYIFLNREVHPTLLFGGTWKRVGVGRTLISAGGGIDPVLGNVNSITSRGLTTMVSSTTSFSVGQTGGTTDVVLDENNLPSRTAVSVKNTSGAAKGVSGNTWSYMSSIANDSYTFTSVYDSAVNSFSSQATSYEVAHNNMPPYLAVYIWERLT